MPMSIDGLFTKVFVRRVGVGAAPFTWEIVGANPGTPLFVSPDRFRSMESAYIAGQNRLSEFLPRAPIYRGKREKAVDLQTSAPTIDWHADDADEPAIDCNLEADGAPSQDSQSHSLMLNDRAA